MGIARSSSEGDATRTVLQGCCGGTISIQETSAHGCSFAGCRWHPGDWAASPRSFLRQRKVLSQVPYASEASSLGVPRVVWSYQRRCSATASMLGRRTACWCLRRTVSSNICFTAGYSPLFLWCSSLGEGILTCSLAACCNV